MEQVLEKNRCTGCTACMNICPKNAIVMKEGKDGFKYPFIDNNKCINCKLCQKICPVINTRENASLNTCYLAYNKKIEEILSSSSGAIFSAIANFILDSGGVVIGAALVNNKLKHIVIEKKEDLFKLKGSKYLQSDLNDMFKYVKENIKHKKVLFAGTPCQVAGLKAFIKNDNDNLYCIDLICHGVPSPKLFSKYIKELESQENSKLKDYNFRNKETGWVTYSNRITFENNNNISELASQNDYMKLFLSDNALRESCYNCNFKFGNKYSDITLGDFWGVQDYYPKTYNKKGTSAVIINTKKGNILFNQIKGSLIYQNCNIEEILNGNPSLSKSAVLTETRKDFFDDLEQLSITALSKKYSKIRKRTLRGRIKQLILKICK